ncbi:MAG: hypothetical protein WBO97_17200, partial [Tepidiformaceae bacterium]
LASAASDQPLPRGTACLGEVALSGSVRPAHQVQRRLAELARVGFKRCLVPPGTAAVEGIQIIPVRTVREALAALYREPVASLSTGSERPRQERRIAGTG